MSGLDGWVDGWMRRMTGEKGFALGAHFLCVCVFERLRDGRREKC